MDTRWLLPTSAHWLGDREDADKSRHAMDMRGCVLYFEQQSDCLHDGTKSAPALQASHNSGECTAISDTSLAEAGSIGVEEIARIVDPVAFATTKESYCLKTQAEYERTFGLQLVQSTKPAPSSPL